MIELPTIDNKCQGSVTQMVVSFTCRTVAEEFKYIHLFISRFVDDNKEVDEDAY